MAGAGVVSTPTATIEAQDPHQDLEMAPSRRGQKIRVSNQSAASKLLSQANCIQISQVYTLYLIISILSPLVTSSAVASEAATENVNSQKTATPTPAAKQLVHTNERINLIEADENGIYLVGLFDIHQSNPRVPFKCGPMDVDETGEWQSRRPMQNLEAFLWAIEQVNADRSLLPGVRLGSLVMDTCSSFLRANQQLANLLHSPHQSQLPHPSQLAGIVADQADWQSVSATVNMASAQGITTFITQSRSGKLGELVKKYQKTAGDDQKLQHRMGLMNEDSPVLMDQPMQPLQLDKLLGELLGIGRMLPSLNFTTISQQTSKEEQQQKMLMVKMVMGNEILAEGLATLLQQMGWDLASVIYDDEPDMVDLHDELAKQMLGRNLQFAMDEQLPVGSGAEVYDRLLLNLAKKTELGSRVVVCLLSATSSRSLLESLKQLRVTATSASSRQTVEQVNQVLWVTVADREPYYSFADEALGTVAMSSATSLMPEFKTYYDGLRAGEHEPQNRWWPEYLRQVMAANQRALAADNQCNSPVAKAQLAQKCRSVSLASIVAAAPADGATRLAKYLAGGWEHNGMDIINAVLAVANGLEAVRQALCPNQASGLCARMRELVSANNNNNNSVQHTVSELLYAELLGSTFQLADGRMFNLDELQAQGGQLEGKFKLYNLRHLQPNSIGFVKFGHYDQLDGLELNVTKARHYPRGQQFGDQQPLEQLKSSCQDENRCLLSSSLRETLTAATANKQSISEEELAAGVNSLFKLDHPSFTEAQFGSSQPQSAPPSPGQPEVHTMRSPRLNWAAQQHHHHHHQRQTTGNETPTTAALMFNTIVLLPLHNKGREEHQSSAVDEPQHQQESGDGSQAPCSPRLDTSHSFQHLAALAYYQTQANDRLDSKIELTTTVIDYCHRPELARRLLEAKLAENSSSGLGRSVAVIDFDAQVSDQIGPVLANRKLLHLTIDSPRHPTTSSGKHHMRLLPSKSNEIQALVKVIGAMPKWQLVHLIYTDHHHYRDEFVRVANEAKICVNKLVWVPGGSQAEDSPELDQNQLEKTAALFKRELYDYSQTSNNNNNNNNGQSQQGLNATRLLVVLASSEPKTNRLILKSATKSMLDDYVWLVSHEWLGSVESDGINQKVPRYLLATRFETFGRETESFRAYYSSLTPSLHQPLPTRWFDQFWQQHFNCSLPAGLIKSHQFAHQDHQVRSVCTTTRLESEKLVEDERVRYAIQAYSSIHMALRAQLEAKHFSQDQFNADFHADFEQTRSNLPLAGFYPAKKSPFGFHILHRSLPSSPSTRRNSRGPVDDDDRGGELKRVGVWRQKHLAMMRPANLNQQNAPTVQWWDPDDEGSRRTMESLAKLANIRSRCWLQHTCQLCRQQLEQSAALAKQEAARTRLAESQGDPNAMSSFGQSATNHEAVYTFDGDDDDEDDNNNNSNKNQDQHDLASSASLFEPKISKQMRDNQLRLQAEHLHRRHQLPSVATIGRPRRQLPFLLMSGLSLAGVVCMLASLSHLYPSMLLRKESAPATRLAKADAHLANLNDYFLLTGLLMLYSINLAFLLPATLSVCWFRRLGLATSYTLVCSALLNKVLVSWRDSQLERTKCRRGSSGGQTGAVGLAPDPIEEGVEVTFESLPPEAVEQQQQQQSAGQVHQEPPETSVQTTVDKSGPPPPPPTLQAAKIQPASLLGLTLALVLFQLLVTLVWFVRQPPEPTLYLGCWRCASPSRSRSLYLFEPLLSLLYPALILIPAWLLSVLVFRLASRNEERTRLDSSKNHGQQRQMDELLREAKSLVMTTTLLVLTWSLLTLNMISSAGSRLEPPDLGHFQAAAGRNSAWAATPPSVAQLQESSGSMGDEFDDLVLANILSGAIIFSFLFIYRLHLFRHCSSQLGNKFRPHQGHHQPPMEANNLQVLKYNQPAGEQRQQERLRLQQFNTTTSNYCTYSERARTTAPGRGLHHQRRQLFGSEKSRAEQTGFRLQRRQSAGSVASSTAKLVAASSSRTNSSLALDSSSLNEDGAYFDDTISCASSVASSSTSQVQGNELYPLDYSIQLEAAGAELALNRSASFSRRSLRRQSVAKLSSVSEEANVRVEN